ncbi:MAG TPA: DUF3631 domain-containing protein [Trebonia sp.]|jgi:hypothetical protein
MSNRKQDYALNRVRRFISTVMHAPDEQLDAMALILALTHVKHISPNVPYVLATGAAESGKSTLTKDIPLLFASNPFIIDRLTTSDGLRNRFLERVSPDSFVFDDASKIWGASGRGSGTTGVTQLAVNGYADTGRVAVSRQGSTVEAPAYGVGFFNGLGDVLPGDVATRCIKFPTVAKPAGIRKRPANSVPVRLEAEPLKKELHRWATANRREMAAWLIENGHRIHPLLDNRLLQLWGPLFAVAHAAGGNWPGLCMSAFLSLGLDESERPVRQRDEQALLDAAKVLTDSGREQLFTADLVPALQLLPDEFYRKVDTRYLVEDLLPQALGEPQLMRGRSLDGRTVRGEGWLASDIMDAAADLMEELNPAPATSGPDRVQRALTLTAVR